MAPSYSATLVSFYSALDIFAGSNAGGERAAAIYSLLGTAKLNGFDPELYLHHVLERIADQPISKINDLMPWNVRLASHAQVA